MDKTLSTIESLCYRTPHVVEQILLFCSPGSFDSARHACKAFYDLSFSRALLKYQVIKLLDAVPSEWNGSIWFNPNRPLVKKVENDDFDVSRLHRMFSREIWLRESSWRIPSRKLVVSIGQSCTSMIDESRQQDAFNLFDTNVVFGTARGDHMAIIWNDRWNGSDTSMAVYQFFQSPENPILSIDLPQDYKDYKPVTVTPRAILKEQTKMAACPGYHLNLDARHNQIPEMPWLVYDRDFAVNLVEGAYRTSISNTGFSTRVPDRQLCSATLHVSCLPKKKARTNWAPLSTNDNGQYIHELEQIHDTHGLNYPLQLSFSRKQKHTNLYVDQAAEEEVNFRLSYNGMCWPTGFASTMNEKGCKRWKINVPVYRRGQNYRMEPLKGVEIKFDRGFESSTSLNIGNALEKIKTDGGKSSQDTTSNSLSLSGHLHPSRAYQYLQNFMPKKEIPLCFTPVHDESENAYSLPLVLPPSEKGRSRPRILMASPSPSFFFKRLKTPSDENLVITPQNLAFSTLPTSYRIDQEDVASDVTLRVVGYDSDNQIVVWDVGERDLLLAALTKTHTVVAKKLAIAEDVKGIATVNHIFGEKIFAMTYGKDMTALKAKCENPMGEAPSPVENEEQSSASNCSEKPNINSRRRRRRGKNASNGNETPNTTHQEKWHLVVFDLEYPTQYSAGVNLDSRGIVERAW